MYDTSVASAYANRLETLHYKLNRNRANLVPRDELTESEWNFLMALVKAAELQQKTNWFYLNAEPKA